MSSKALVLNETLFKNTFHIDDLQVFNDDVLRRMLSNEEFGLTVDALSCALQGADSSLVERIRRNLPSHQRRHFRQSLRQPVSHEQVEHTRKQILDRLFWELTYWKTPELYEELTAGEQLHPGIFRQLAADLQGKIVADVGAGSGRASFECVHYGARLVHAIEPSPGLLHILEQKREQQPEANRILACNGRFEHIPLADRSVDLTLSCSAFTTDPEQGGEPGLEEMKRITRPGGKIVLIWPRVEDRHWLQEHGFHYVSLPVHREMRVRFRSLHSAIHCARLFYARNKGVLRYLLKRRKPEVPFSVIGVNPPCDYCWLEVS